MTMESPVRIYLSAAIVVHLLLLGSTIVIGNALPNETEAPDSFEEYLKSENHASFILNLNKTFNLSKRPKREATTQVDVALKESNHREPQISENHSENNTKSRTEAHDSFEEYLNSENHTSFILNLNKTFQLFSKRPKREATSQVDVALNESNHRQPQISEKHSDNNTKSITEAPDSFEEYLNSENHTSFILNLNKTFQLFSKRPKREATTQVDVALKESNHKEPQISEKHSDNNTKSITEAPDSFEEYLNSENHTSFILNLNKTFQLFSKRPKREATTQVDVALKESNHREPQISEKHSDNNTKSITEAPDSFEEYLNSENHTSFILNLNKTFQLFSKRPKREATTQVDVALKESNHREPQISEKHSDNNTKSITEAPDSFEEYLNSENHTSFILNLNKTFQLFSKRPKREATRQVDVALNELNPREPEISEEHSDKNAKSRGRVRFHSQLKSSTESSFKRITSRTTTDVSTSDPSKVVIVTPTPDVKKPSQIIDSMRTYKKIKMPAVTSSSTNPTLELADSASNENDEEQDNNSNEKPTTANVRVNNSFAMPNYTKKSIRRDSRRRDGARNKVKSESFGPDSYFSSENSFERNKFKSDTYFNFESDLTTPKNDFFDKKFSEIQHSIVKNLESVQSKPPNMTNVRKIIKKNIGHENFNNRSPKNKSSLYFKNTKEIQISDSEKAGTSNKELSDVQGTSIYYEMSVLSTETYAINNLNDDDDCDESAPESTVSTSVEQELAAIDTNQEAPVSNKSKVQAIDSKAEPINSLASNYLPFPGNVPDVYNPITPLSYSTLGPISTQNYVSSTEKSILLNRSKTPKRLNFTGTKESPNSFTTKPNAVPTRNSRPSSRRFHYTTPKIKPIWMAPRRNSTRTYSRSTLPTTIYQEYFDIKDKYTTTTKPKDTNKSTLSTVSSDIDPVQQSDVSGIKKVVHSNSISENSIPSLWKRGSTKFSTSTASSSAETDSGVSEMEIPPTLTAWALASLRSPPSMSTSGLNVTSTTPKSVDDDDLQNVGEVTDKKEPSTRIAVTSSNMLNSDVVTSKVEEMDQNRLSWHQIFAPSVSVESQAEVQTNESLINKLPDRPYKDSHSDQSISSEGTINTDLFGNLKALTEKEESEETEEIIKDEEASKANKTLDVQNTIGFESITKLPAEVTTPPDDFDSNNTPVESSNKLSTFTDYEITTIRFSYKPTEEPMTEEFETTTWYATPTRTKTTIMDGPITTYRPKYVTTTDVPLDTSTFVTETTTVLVTSESYEHETEPTTTISDEVKEPSTAMTSEIETTTINSIVVETTALPETKEETTITVVDIVTEINKATLPQESTTASTDSPSERTETPLDETSQSYENYSSSEENNEVITQETLKPSSTTSSSTGASTTFITTTTELTTKLNTETEEPKPTVTTITSLEAEVPTTETQKHAKITTTVEQLDEVTMDVTTDVTTKSVSSLEDLTSYGGEVTTESSSRVLTEEAGSGAAIAIAVSTIGVIALILLVGLLLVVRRRGRRGAYAHRCTPVSLDAYSLDSVSVGHRKGQRIRASKRSYGNPAYDDEVTSHPMQYAALANFALDMDSMTAEFAEIPTVTVRPDEVPPGCEDKNRYSNVLPLPETRVPLARIGNDPTTEYINANYITGPGNIRNYYIACQAPLASTVADFWRMVWEQNSRVIVMLTEYMENGVEKCYEYLPPSEISDNRRTFGEYQIILKKREQKDKYAVSSVQLINLTTRTWREITHLWYFWPAKGVPDDYDSVIDFLSEMRGYMKISQAAKEYDEDGVEVIYEDENRSSFQNLSKFRSDDSSSVNGVNVYSPAKAEEQLKRHGNGTLSRMKAASEVQAVRPCVVVCASGAGRSAALVAADICARALAAGQVDVPRVVRELRAQRPHSLANRHHYILLYKVLSEYGNKLMGGGVDTI